MATARQPEDSDLPASTAGGDLPDANAEQHVVILSGLSGGGKTAAAGRPPALGALTIMRANTGPLM